MSDDGENNNAIVDTPCPSDNDDEEFDFTPSVQRTDSGMSFFNSSIISSVRPPPPLPLLSAPTTNRPSLSVRRGCQTQMGKLSMGEPRGRLTHDTSMAEDCLPDESDIPFVYNDSDTYVGELREIYAYSELADFAQNADAYKHFVEMRKINAQNWSSTPLPTKKEVMHLLMDEMELACKTRRGQALRSTLYLLQGAFMDYQGAVDMQAMYTDDDRCVCQAYTSAYLFVEMGMLEPLVFLLTRELDASADPMAITDTQPIGSRHDLSSQSSCAFILSLKIRELLLPVETDPCKKPPQTATMNENVTLRLVLSALCHVIEAMRHTHTDINGTFKQEEIHRQAQTRQVFAEFLQQPLPDGRLLPLLLLQMVTTFCSGATVHYPMRKVLLLLWKSLLVDLGGWDTLRTAKEAKRADLKLSPCEDTITTAAAMRASAPPPLPALLQHQRGDGELSIRGRRPVMSGRMLPQRQLAYQGDSGDKPDDENIETDTLTEQSKNTDEGVGGDSDSQKTETSRASTSSSCSSSSSSTSMTDDSSLYDALSVYKHGCRLLAHVENGTYTPDVYRPTCEQLETLLYTLREGKAIRHDDTESLPDLNSTNGAMQDADTSLPDQPPPFIHPLSEVEKAMNETGEWYESTSPVARERRAIRETSVKRFAEEKKEMTGTMNGYSLHFNAALVYILDTVEVSRMNFVRACEIVSEELRATCDRDTKKTLTVIEEYAIARFYERTPVSESSADEDPFFEKASAASTTSSEGPFKSHVTELQNERHSGTLRRSGRGKMIAELNLGEFIDGKNATLPWMPKTRQADILAFLTTVRSKFLGLSFDDFEDTTTMIGLPEPTVKAVNTLKKHIYTSHTELDIERERRLRDYPFSQKEKVPESNVERLYGAMLSHMPQYLIALLKILLVAAPSSKAKTDAINILCDCIRDEEDCELVQHQLNMMSTSSSSANMCTDDDRSSLPQTEAHIWRTAKDVQRHKEIIAKSISAIILLLLKHFRLNHAYQFEHVAQHLVFANCIPLILKFFDQNIHAYVQRASDIEPLNFPQSVIYHAKSAGTDWPPVDHVRQAELQSETATSEPMGDVFSAPPSRQATLGDADVPTCPKEPAPPAYAWRNIFTAINLLRTLNKLTKWKHARTMMLVVFKSAPILKRTLRVRQVLLQLYALKLLKMQAKYLGRPWRKGNMEIMSAIYSKVRHRLNDDWAYGNDSQTKQYDFHADEAQIRHVISAFNDRRYKRVAVPGCSGGICELYCVVDGFMQITAPPSANAGIYIDAVDGPPLTDDIGDLTGVPQLDATQRICGVHYTDADFVPVDNNLVSVLAQEMTFTDTFLANYDKWLDREVFEARIDWDAILEKRPSTMNK